jgi:hypothetical protein
MISAQASAGPLIVSVGPQAGSAATARPPTIDSMSSTMPIAEASSTLPGRIRRM